MKTLCIDGKLNYSVEKTQYGAEIPNFQMKTYLGYITDAI
jgi:hypothetical protein